jgi:transposase
MQERGKRRFVGIDLSKRTYAMAVIDRKGGTASTSGLTTADGRSKLCAKLEREDKVGLEAGNMAFILAKEIIAKVGCEVVVLNPHKLRMIYDDIKKTDKIDAIKIAQVLEDYRDSRLPKVPLPCDQEMARRELLSQYRGGSRARSTLVHRLHALFHKSAITTIVRKDLAAKPKRDKSITLLGGQEAEEAVFLCGLIDLYEGRLEILKKRIEDEAEKDENMKRLMTVPGVGPIVAFAFVSYIGDVSRFANTSQVSSYLGLVPKVEQSGNTCHYGHITRRGNGYLRSLLVQAAWVTAIRTKMPNLLKDKYNLLAPAKGKKKAIAAVARKMAALMWTLMKTKSDFEFRKFTPPPKAKTEAQKLAALAEELQAA